MKLHMDLYAASMGKIFRVTHACRSVEEANAVMKSNSDVALIAEDDGLFFLARKYGSVAPSEILRDMQEVRR